jgi:hypothetical protein
MDRVLAVALLGISSFTGCTPASMDLVAPEGSGGSATGGHEPLPCKNANGGGGGASTEVGTSGAAGSSSRSDNMGGAGGNGAAGGAYCPMELDPEIYGPFTIGQPRSLQVSVFSWPGGVNGPATFWWTAINERCHSSGGTFSDTTNLTPTFTCDEEGLVTLTLHIGVASTSCDSVYTHLVQCVP